MEEERKMDLVLLASELLLVSGAEIHRIEETAERMGTRAGFVRVDAFATPTGMIMTVMGQTGHTITRIRRVHDRKSNLATIAAVNALSRQFEEGLSLTAMEEQLQSLADQPTRRTWLMLVGGAVGSGSFAIVFGGSIADALLASFIGMLVQLVVTSPAMEHFPRFLSSALGGVIAAALGLIGQSWGFCPDISILAGVMILVPGVTMTTSLQDMLSGELVSGAARGAEAMTIAVAVAAGVAFSLGVGGALL